MKHSTGKPTEAEDRRISRMMLLGCAACAHLEIWVVAQECHHILQGNKRLGHWYTIPLCKGHHRGIWNLSQQIVIPEGDRVSISDGRKAFTRVYPPEKQLWIEVQHRLRLSTDWPESKVLPRRLRA